MECCGVMFVRDREEGGRRKLAKRFRKQLESVQC